MKKHIYIILGIIQLFVALGALPAGYSMIVEPNGSGLGMNPGFLEGSPFHDYFIPGLFLFTVNGLFNLAGATVSFFKGKYTGLIGIGLGASLIVWITVQVLSIQMYHFLQPVYFVIGAIEIVLGYLWIKANHRIDSTIIGLR
jgi:hypothetical protein